MPDRNGTRGARTGLLRSLLLAAGLTACGPAPLRSAAEPPTPAGGPPSVVWIVADDMGWADAGFQGSRAFLTPNLDRLASEGVRCTAAYTSASVCSPSRAGMLTGRYQQRFGHEFNLTPDQPLGLPPEQLTLAEHLAAHGYATGLVGKWHLGQSPGLRPLDQGFQRFFGILGGSRNYFPGTAPPPEHQALMRGATPLEEPRGGYVTELFGDEAARFVREAPRPFFLMLSFTAPHTPLQARTALRARFSGMDEERATLAAMTLAMDRAVGQVLEALDRSGARRETLVVFLGDNGGAISNHASNDPLHGFKGSHLEGGVRVPFVASWPGRIPAGRGIDEAVSALDLFPTACSAAGVPVPAGLDGLDLMPLLSGRQERLPERPLFWRRGERAAVRLGPWKLIREGQRLRLHDLSTPEGEARDLSRQEPEVLARLAQRLGEWERELARPLWTLESRRDPQ